MRYPTSRLLVALLATALASAMPAPAVAQGQQGGALATRQEAQAAFDSARASFVKQDFQAAADALRRAANFLSTQAGTAEAGAKGAFAEAARGLDELSQDVEKGGVKTAEALDRAFARAHQAEAHNHYLRAKDALTRKENTTAGEEMLMAADHLERGAKDAGERLKGGSVTAVQHARATAGKLIRNTRLAAEEVDKDVAALGKEIERLSATLRRG